MLDQTSFVAETVLEKYSWTENRKYLQKQIHKPVTVQIHLKNYLKYHAVDPSLHYVSITSVQDKKYRDHSIF